MDFFRAIRGIFWPLGEESPLTLTALGLSPTARKWYKCCLIMKAQTRFAPLELRVLKTIREFALLGRGEHVLAAVSGGADSTALLLCPA